ncbi:hypothetical protein TWF730_004890 [Orbilia blumenaviensis]|uniref:Uncharacterized protein n=1 Tax=Orbilia blumenaviensis TaxID=1796055 RepID=A0AAV9VIW1_9PEZI
MRVDQESDGMETRAGILQNIYVLKTVWGAEKIASRISLIEDKMAFAEKAHEKSLRGRAVSHKISFSVIRGGISLEALCSEVLRYQAQSKGIPIKRGCELTYVTRGSALITDDDSEVIFLSERPVKRQRATEEIDLPSDD